MAQDIFICHASEDAAAANELVTGLEESGITCWIAPRDVMPGADYAQAIVAGISRAKALVLVFSTRSNVSQQVGREVERAVSRGIDIIPFRIDDIEPAPSLEYFISTSQWLDATAGPIQDHVGELARTIRILVYGQEGDVTRQAAGDILRQIVDEYGPALAEDPRRVRALLRDMAGEHRAEVAALVAAAEEGVGSGLLQSSQGLTPETIQRLARKLQDNRALTEEASRWAVAAWSHALRMDAPAPQGLTTPVTGGLPETVAAVAARHPSGQPEPVASPDVQAGEPTIPAQPGESPAIPTSGHDAGPATIPASPAAPRHTAPAPSAQPPSGSGRRWVAVTAIGVLAIGGVVGAVALFGGDDSDPGGGIPTTQAPPATTTPQQTTAVPSAFFAFDGLTAADVVDRWSAEASSIELTAGCATLLQLEPIDVTTDRLGPGETFVWGRFAAPFCNTEIWGIETQGGTLRELTVQVESASDEAVSEMMDVAMALVGTVGQPESSGAFARSALDEFGWLSAPDPTAHQGDAVLGAIQLGTFLHDGGFTFYMVPAG
ncbi:MAG: TIR domain-containing protein [Acidimicrobiia bacterium]|nr:TIR domain-containing protein [Acidimicrobiia bacterium]MBT8192779.1 TIR domain-containing protein [Acidimicrobiia bacterium]NNF08766.1 TIR domain-containing protein [Acidimicrobiia bacterium]